MGVGVKRLWSTLLEEDTMRLGSVSRRLGTGGNSNDAGKTESEPDSGSAAATSDASMRVRTAAKPSGLPRRA
jgi:hypothetical protein